MTNKMSVCYPADTYTQAHSHTPSLTYTLNRSLQGEGEVLTLSEKVYYYKDSILEKKKKSLKKFLASSDEVAENTIRLFLKNLKFIP